MNDWKIGVRKIVSVLLIIIGIAVMALGIFFADATGGVFTGAGSSWVLAFMAEVLGIACMLTGLAVRQRLKKHGHI